MRQDRDSCQTPAPLGRSREQTTAATTPAAGMFSRVDRDL